MRVAFVSSFLAMLILGCGGSQTEETDAGTSDRDAGAIDTGRTDAGPVADAGAERDGASVSGRVGEACAADSECPGGGSGVTTCLLEWPGGYCAVVSCAEHGHDCPGDPGLGGTATTGSKCVAAPELRCLALCASDADCRSEYVCAPRPDSAGHATSDVCVPRSAADAGMSGDGGMGGM